MMRPQLRPGPLSWSSLWILPVRDRPAPSKEEEVNDVENAIEEQERPGYYAVIPADVRYDQSLPANAKLLYGEISALARKDGCCYAGNAYFAGLYGCTEPTVTRLISALVKAGYIARQVVKDKTGQIVLRKLWLKVSVPEELPPYKNDGTPQQFCMEGTHKNVGYKNTSSNNIKDPQEGPVSKRKNPCLTDEQIQAFCVEWIKTHGESWTAPEKNALYASVVGFYSPRDTKKHTPSRTLISVKTLFSKLRDYGAGNPAAMKEMLDRAIMGNWKSVFPLNDSAPAAEPPKEEKTEWL